MYKIVIVLSLLCFLNSCGDEKPTLSHEEMEADEKIKRGEELRTYCWY